jgi:hypothetical protein
VTPIRLFGRAREQRSSPNLRAATRLGSSRSATSSRLLGARRPLHGSPKDEDASPHPDRTLAVAVFPRRGGRDAMTVARGDQS